MQLFTKLKKYSFNEMSIVSIDNATLSDLIGKGKSAPVCFYFPKRDEIQKIVEVAKAVSNRRVPIILDIGCGNGFLDYLLAKTGEVKVIGIDPNAKLIKRSREVYDHPNLLLKIGDAKKALKYKDKVDVVLNSWMPINEDLTPLIKEVGGKAIVYVKFKDGNTVTGVQYGEKQSYDPGKEYVKAFEWSSVAGNEVLAIVEGKHSRFVKAHPDKVNLNKIEIQIRKDVEIPKLSDVKVSEKYSWERDLE